MAEVMSEIAAVTPTGIPWRVKTAELMETQQLDMLYAILKAAMPPIVRESRIRGKRRLDTIYISDEVFLKMVSQLRKSTVVLDSASEADLEEYLAESPTDNIVFRQTLQGMLLDLPPKTKGLLASALKGLRYGDQVHSGLIG